MFNLISGANFIEIFGYLRKNIFRLVFNLLRLLRLNFVENGFYGENVLAMLFINVVKIGQLINSIVIYDHEDDYHKVNDDIHRDTYVDL